MSEFKNVTAVKKANVYFEGKSTILCPALVKSIIH